MSTFNPFNKSIEKVTAADLNVLKTISEGWYIEYKRDVPKSASDIAKSISSFANHSGGWIFYGVSSSSGGDNFAAGYPGISVEDWPKLQERISSAVSSCLDPSPYFEINFIRGESKRIGLNAKRGIIVIYVPQGLDTPYVHSSGRIYRRIADQSTPKEIKERAVFDLLTMQREKAAKRLQDFLMYRPVLAKREQNWSIFTIYLMCNPLIDFAAKSNLTFSQFKSIMSGREGYGCYPCNTFFSSGESFVARQVLSHSQYEMCLTFRHFFNGTSVLQLPLISRAIRENIVPEISKEYSYQKQFVEFCRKGGLDDANLIDLNLIFTMIYRTIIYHYSLLNQGGISTPTYFKAHLSSIWRCVPFVDTEEYLEQLKEDGIPVIQENECFAPPGTEPDSFLKIKTGSEVSRSYQPFLATIAALGLGRQFNEQKLSKWFEAESRGIRAHMGLAKSKNFDDTGIY